VLAPALLLYGTERLGKAVRSPAKDTLLSYASARVGRGSAFGVHQALDQTGAVLGPLLLAAILAWREGDYRLAFGALAVPGVAVLVLLLWLRVRVPDPTAYEPEDARPAVAADGTPVREPLPARFWQYVAAVAVLSCGIASFPLIAFHAQTKGLLTDAQVPLLFAVAMLVDGASGPVVGRVYDRRGPMVLLAVPVAAGLSVVTFADQVWLVWLGVAIWGVVNGVLDSTVKAVVADLVPGASRSVAFGWLAFVRGLGLLVAGGLLGAAYDWSTTALAVLVLGANAAALVGLAAVLRRIARTPDRT
jgi:MFS family permease